MTLFMNFFRIFLQKFFPYKLEHKYQNGCFSAIRPFTFYKFSTSNYCALNSTTGPFIKTTIRNQETQKLNFKNNY